MKTIILLITSVVLAGCSSPRTQQSYRNLNYGQTVVEELRILESTRMPSIQLNGVTLARVCQSLSTAYSEPPETGFLNISLVEDPVIGAMKVNLYMENISLAQVYDELCEQTNSTWWVNRYIYLQPKTQK